MALAGTFGMVTEKKNILSIINKYDEMDENLRKHAPDYPKAGYLAISVLTVPHFSVETVPL